MHCGKRLLTFVLLAALSSTLRRKLRCQSLAQLLGKREGENSDNGGIFLLSFMEGSQQTERMEKDCGG